MKLNAQMRAEQKKSDIKKLRRDGDIPAVIYSSSSPFKMIKVNRAEFENALRGIKQGLLPTTHFMLQLDKHKIDAIVKDIQYDITNYKVIHLDFEQLHKEIPVTVKIPINCIGGAECIGVKQGGVLRQIIRYVTVSCLPKDMPEQFEIDVRDLGLGQSLKLSNIAMPQGVKPSTAADEVVLVVGKAAVK